MRIYILDKFLEVETYNLRLPNWRPTLHSTNKYETKYPNFTWYYIDIKVSWDPNLLFYNSIDVCPVVPKGFMNYIIFTH